MSSQEGHTNNGNDFVERRRAALERYLKRTAQHPALLSDPDFREFLESGKCKVRLDFFTSLPYYFRY